MKRKILSLETNIQERLYKDLTHLSINKTLPKILVVNFLKITLQILRHFDTLILWMSWLKKRWEKIFSFIFPCTV
jgi:hypothetical protein